MEKKPDEGPEKEIVVLVEAKRKGVDGGELNGIMREEKRAEVLAKDGTSERYRRKMNNRTEKESFRLLPFQSSRCRRRMRRERSQRYRSFARRPGLGGSFILAILQYDSQSRRQMNSKGLSFFDDEWTK